MCNTDNRHLKMPTANQEFALAVIEKDDTENDLLTSIDNKYSVANSISV